MNARSVRETHPAVVDARQFAAVRFDMDGVLINTARVHLPLGSCCSMKRWLT